MVRKVLCWCLCLLANPKAKDYGLRAGTLHLLVAWHWILVWNDDWQDYRYTVDSSSCAVWNERAAVSGAYYLLLLTGR